jgi:predicted dehydrogenase
VLFRSVYIDYIDLLKDDTIDAVYVCTPNSSHAEISIKAMEFGKHVMCEKPMALNSIEARAMLDASKKYKKKLNIGYQNRYKQEFQFLKKYCINDGLGEIYFAKAHALRRRAVPTWGVFLDEEKQGGGPLIDIGTHSLDLTLWLMNNYKPKTVLGQTYHKLNNLENAANAFGPWDPKKFKVEDSAFGFIVMENGASIFLESSWALNIVDFGEAKCTLCGTKGGADFNHGLRINGEEYSKLYTKEIDIKASGVDFYGSKLETEGEMESRLFIESILNDTETFVKPEEALVVTQILEAIYTSAKTGEAVNMN